MDTKICKPKDDKIIRFESSPTGLEKRAKKKGMPGTSILDTSFGTVDVLTQSHNSSHKYTDDNEDDDFDGNHWIIEADDPQAPDDLAFQLHTVRLFEKQKIISSVNSDWPQKPVILAQVSMKTTMRACTADTHPYLN